MGWAGWLCALWPVGSLAAVAFFHGCRLLSERSRGLR